MHVKFGRVSWEDLQRLRGLSEPALCKDATAKRVQRQFIVGLAHAIDMEIRRREMAREGLHGSTIMSIDLEFEPERRLDFRLPGKKISLKELDELANERQQRAIEQENRRKEIDAMEAAQQQVNAGSTSGAK